MSKLPKIIIIVGPTASGKTALSLKLAENYNGEIVSADSRQIYRGMDIGTAKPTKEEMFNIPHHLIDIKNPDEDYSVGQYKKDAIEVIEDILNRGKLPILIGGTGLYISAIAYNLDFPAVSEDKKLRHQLEQEAEEKGLNVLFERLIELDPEAAYIVDPKNSRRVIRALEVAILTGQPFSAQRQKSKPLFDMLMIGINPGTELMNERIIKRAHQMVTDGLADEVKSLVAKYGSDQKAFDAIGYREYISYLQGKCSLDEATEEMIKNTRRYAKRQIQWFKRDTRIHWMENSGQADGLVENFLQDIGGDLRIGFAT